MARLQGSGKTASSMAMMRRRSRRRMADTARVTPAADRAGALDPVDADVGARAGRRGRTSAAGRASVPAARRPAARATSTSGLGDGQRRAGHRHPGQRLEQLGVAAGPRRRRPAPPAAGLRHLAGRRASGVRAGRRAGLDRRPAPARLVPAGEDLAPPGVDHRGHRAGPAARRGRPRPGPRGWSRPTTPIPSPWARPLAVATPTRRPVKRPGPTSTAMAAEVGQRSTPACSRTWVDGRGERLGVAAPARAHTPARGPSSPPTATPTSSVALSMPRRITPRPPPPPPVPQPGPRPGPRPRPPAVRPSGRHLRRRSPCGPRRRRPRPS